MIEDTMTNIDDNVHTFFQGDGNFGLNMTERTGSENRGIWIQQKDNKNNARLPNKIDI